MNFSPAIHFATLTRRASSPPSPAVREKERKTLELYALEIKLPSPDVGRRVGDEGSISIRSFERCSVYRTFAQGLIHFWKAHQSAFFFVARVARQYLLARGCQDLNSAEREDSALLEKMYPACQVPKKGAIKQTGSYQVESNGQQILVSTRLLNSCPEWKASSLQIRDCAT